VFRELALLRALLIVGVGAAAGCTPFFSCSNNSLACATPCWGARSSLQRSSSTSVIAAPPPPGAPRPVACRPVSYPLSLLCAVWVMLYGVFANVVYAAHSTPWCAVVALCSAAVLVVVTAILLKLRADNSCALRSLWFVSRMGSRWGAAPSTTPLVASPHPTPRT
jgi:hypothetical protein